MRRRSVNWKLLLSCIVCLLFAAAVAGSEQSANEAALSPTQSKSNQDNYFTHGSKFDCLPKDVGLNDVVTATKTKSVTVEKTLIQMKAQCRQGKLVDAKRREIRFFRPSCWGNPPADYLEIQQRESAELQKLKKTYTVIVFACNQMIQ